MYVVYDTLICEVVAVFSDSCNLSVIGSGDRTRVTIFEKMRPYYLQPGDTVQYFVNDYPNFIRNYLIVNIVGHSRSEVIGYTDIRSNFQTVQFSPIEEFSKNYLKHIEIPSAGN